MLLRKGCGPGPAGHLCLAGGRGGELSRDLRRGDRETLAEEFADVFAWLASLASLCDIELEDAVAKYAGGVPQVLGQSLPLR